MGEANKGGRPSIYTSEIEEALLDWLYEGKSLASFCRADGHPKLRTVYDWCDRMPEVSARFTRARRAGAAAKVDEASDTMDNATKDTWQLAKAQAEHAMKVAACYASDIFGTKAQVQHSGGLALQVVTGVPVPAPEAK